ncbi:hypothetical protein J6590_044038 [Homalodisca vitripennis]|nr:hypothetical protein J6590_044038 [Homalodisca vitripennis]
MTSIRRGVPQGSCLDRYCLSCSNTESSYIFLRSAENIIAMRYRLSLATRAVAVVAHINNSKATLAGRPWLCIRSQVVGS